MYCQADTFILTAKNLTTFLFSLGGWWMVSMVRGDKGQIETHSAQFDILIEILSRSQCCHLWGHVRTRWGPGSRPAPALDTRIN